MPSVEPGAIDALEGFLSDAGYVILYRDPLCRDAFRNLLKEAGVKAVRLPTRSSNLNAYAERFVRTIKENFLERLILFRERSLWNAVRELRKHYHHERNHLGLGNHLIHPHHEIGILEGCVACRERLGGILRYYYRDAA